MEKRSKFQYLMEPGTIGPVKTRNRIIKTGAGLQMWHESDVRMNTALKYYYESLARGGVGLIIVESPTIDYPKGARWPERYRLDHDKYINGMGELVDVIHQHGCPTFMQMNHDGPWQVNIPFVDKPLFSGPPVAASAVSMKSDNDFHNEVPKELTIAEIEEIIDKFAAAAVRASKAGFDGVDINAASSHLLHNFFSPFWNRRNDIYGGSLENRARFATRIIGEIKNRLGKDFPVSVCINGMEIGQLVGIDNDQCLTASDSRQIAKLLEKAGADAIQIRSHWLGYHVGAYLTDVFFYPEPPISPESFPKEYNQSRKGVAANVPLAAATKKELTIPVIVVGKLDHVIGNQILKAGQVDFIGMTRRLQADPELPNKVASGRTREIAPCTACENCLGTQRCRINTFLGKEYNTIEKANRRKNVIVIGGGPAGLEAARVSALRGHTVTLYDKSTRLGGLLPIASLVKGTQLEDLPALIRYYDYQLKRLGVRCKLGRTVSARAILQKRPDALFLATGGTPTLPPIKGIDNPNVVSGKDLYGRIRLFLKLFQPETLRKLTRFYLPIGKRVVIIGGGIQGCELAEFLTKRGRQVTIVDTAENLGTGMVDVLMAHLFMWFDRKGVARFSGVREYVEITGSGLSIIDKDGQPQTIQADTIIPALPLTPNQELHDQLKDQVHEIYLIGDCREPGLIADAIGTAAGIARNV